MDENGEEDALKSWLPGVQALTLNILMIVGAVLVMLTVLVLLRLYDSHRLPLGKAIELRQQREEAWEAVYLAVSMCSLRRLWIACFQQLMPAYKSYRLYMPNYSTGLTIAGMTKIWAAYALAYDGWDLAKDVWSDVWAVFEDWLREKLDVEEEVRW